MYQELESSDSDEKQRAFDGLVDPRMRDARGAVGSQGGEVGGVGGGENAANPAGGRPQQCLQSFRGIARGRLQEERKSWRKDHPHGFVAKPATLPDGTQDILNWDVVIPGKDGTIWENARIPMTMTFSEDYPNKPPICKFKLVGSTGKPLFHPNVYPSGKICLSLLDPDKGWKPSLTIKHLLVGIQSLLDEPNNQDPAQEEPFKAYKHNKAEYEQKVKAQVAMLRGV